MEHELKEIPMAFAKFDTRCMVCDDDILEGDPIVLLPFEDEWVHADCAVDCE